MARKDTQYEVTWLVRRLFRAMAERSGEDLARQGISAADRAVLEFLYPDQALTVPAIADRYQVSRQHVQVTVNRLLDKHLVTTAHNPQHKRSPLVTLTATGAALFADVLKHDRTEIDRLFSGVPTTDLESTRATLAHLLQRLKEGSET